MKQVAVLLAGCGHLDGTEINEAVLTILALRQNGLKPVFFGLNKAQFDYVDHRTGAPSVSFAGSVGGASGVVPTGIEMASRIVRGQIAPMESLDPSLFSGLVIPGGFGVAKNFCSFARDGAAASLDPIVKQVLEGFVRGKKPVLAVCIAPMLLAILGAQIGLKMRLTLGALENGAAQAATKLGASLEEAKPSQFVVDADHLVITTPAYMWDTAPEEIFIGISGAAKKFSEWIEA